MQGYIKGNLPHASMYHVVSRSYIGGQVYMLKLKVFNTFLTTSVFTRLMKITGVGYFRAAC